MAKKIDGKLWRPRSLGNKKEENYLKQKLSLGADWPLFWPAIIPSSGHLCEEKKKGCEEV
jgi:hypothetical protein